MSQREAYLALMRPCILHILRAAGFHAARPGAVDVLADLATRYLELLATKTAEYAELTHNGTLPTTTDARMAMQYAGLLKPELHPSEEQLYEDDDMRGISSLVTWFEGPQAKEIRRIAGVESDDGAMNVEGDAREDYLTALKKKHSKTGEEERFRGTMLGKDLPARRIVIEGGPPSIAAWNAQMRCEKLPELQEDAESG